MKNMKELCICRDRKYCNVIQHDISFLNSLFRFFLRQQTECTLDYSAVEDAKRTQRKYNIMKLLCYEPNRCRYIVSEQINIFPKFLRLELTENSFV